MKVLAKVKISIDNKLRNKNFSFEIMTLNWAVQLLSESIDD